MKALTASGSTAAQLAMLGDAGLDAEAAGELALIAREAAWQLRAVARQARRRWQQAAGEALAPPLQGWFDEVDALCARWLSPSQAAADDATGAAMPG